MEESSHEKPIGTADVIGIPLGVTDYAGAVSVAMGWGQAAAAPRLIAAANTHVVTLARCNPQFAAALAQFDLVLPDGMPLVWVMNRGLAQPLLDRVYGPTFMLHALEATQDKPHLFIGGSEELLAVLTLKLLGKFPALNIAGTYSPPFGEWPEGEDERIIETIRRSGAQYVWLGLGCPKQELWLARHKSQLPPAVYAAVGAAFAFHAGKVRQAPGWMQRNGLEWLFRLAMEPRRLFRRYFTYNGLFLFHLTRDWLLPAKSR